MVILMLGGTINTFSDNFSTLLAQMDTDLDNLVAAVFNGANTTLYGAYLETLLFHKMTYSFLGELYGFVVSVRKLIVLSFRLRRNLSFN
jgi:hypothetical protein